MQQQLQHNLDEAKKATENEKLEIAKQVKTEIKNKLNETKDLRQIEMMEKQNYIK